MKRRPFLFGTTASFAGSILGPLFRSLAEAAASPGSTRRPRFVLYVHANGLQRTKIRESTWSAADGFKLAGALAPLEPHASDLLVVESLYTNAASYLHGNASAAVTCASRGNRGGGADAGGAAPKLVGGISIDQVIASQISRPKIDGVRTSSLVLGMPLIISGGDCTWGTIVGTGDNAPVFPVTDPMKAYGQLFGGAAGASPDDPAVAARLAARRSQLDHLLSEIKAVKASLPAQQQRQLDLYLTSVRALEDAVAGQAGTPGAACAASSPALQSTTRSRRNDPALWKTFLDLGIAALRCGLTRQVTLLHSYGCIHYMYTFDGQTKNHHEEVAHREENGPFMTKILAWHAQQVAYIYSQLKASGDADDTVVMYMSDGGGRHHGGSRSYPIVLLGKPGAILRTGRSVTYPEGQASLARFHLSVARAFGSPITSFGDGTDPGSGPLTELLV